ncbi:MAG: YbbR-like domain-containing protein [Desulfuromonadaceae bacterium]|nr:YbbR-like domain-containing protein [Desulfuromonadaceae bacterium]
MLQLVLNNWHLKLLSLVFALMLWLFVMGEQNAEVGYTVPLELKNLPSGFVVANEVPSLVDVRISGPRTLLSNIQVSGLILSVDLRGAQPGLTTFRRLEEHLNLPRALKVTRLSPSYVEVKLEHVRRKDLPVRVVLKGRPAEGVELDRVLAAPDRIKVEGAESEMAMVSEVETEAVNLADVRENFSLTVPLSYQGTYSRLVDAKTVDVEIYLKSNPQQAAEPLPPLQLDEIKDVIRD